jgi:hypothetical protein
MQCLPEALEEEEVGAVKGMEYVRALSHGDLRQGCHYNTTTITLLRVCGHDSLQVSF